MLTRKTLAVVLAFGLAAPLIGFGQEQKAAPTPSTERSEVKPCLIVKHKSTIARRLTFTLLIGLPIAPGASYDYVDAVNYTAKPRYKGKELQQVQAQGVHVIVLEKKYTQENLDSARASCYAPAVITPTTPAAPTKPEAQPAQPKQEGKPPAEQKQEAKPPAQNRRSSSSLPSDS